MTACVIILLAIISNMKMIILIIVIFMDCADSRYPDCVNCPDGEWLRRDKFYLFYYCCIYI